MSSRKIGNEILFGSTTLTIMGNGFGSVSRTSKAFVQSSDCEKSEWKSDTSILCGLTNAFARGSVSIGLTAVGTITTLSEAISFDSPMISSVRKTNIASPEQARSLTISGFNFAYSSPNAVRDEPSLPSMGVRLHVTSSEETKWVSQTSVVAVSYTHLRAHET